MERERKKCKHACAKHFSCDVQDKSPESFVNFTFPSQKSQFGENGKTRADFIDDFLNQIHLHSNPSKLRS